MKKLYQSFLILYFLCFYLLPLSVFAVTDFKGLVYGVTTEIVKYIIFIIVSLSLLSFLWGMAKFILNAGNETEREKGKKTMVWGLLSLFVMVSLMGIVYMIRVAFFGADISAFLPTNL